MCLSEVKNQYDLCTAALWANETLTVFEIVPYSLTHYSLYSIDDIVNYIVFMI